MEKEDGIDAIAPHRARSIAEWNERRAGMFGPDDVREAIKSYRRGRPTS